MGAQVGATRLDGSAYECNFGKEFASRHIFKEWKTTERLIDARASMPAVAQVDLNKAL